MKSTFLLLLSIVITTISCHTISNAGIELIKQFEGCVLTAYWDSDGQVWTIGYGTTSASGKNVYQGLTISQATADQWLKETIDNNYGRSVDKYDSIYKWTQNEFDALCSFAYNIGSIDGLVNKGNLPKSQIPEKMKEYVYAANGKKVLVTRRNKEVEYYYNGSSGGSGGSGGSGSNGRCGSGYGKCPAGECCSKWGYCGKTSEYCSNSQGCQLAYGDCRCGNGFGNCEAGSCCSKWGYCGKTSEYCSNSQGCQLAYGDCRCGSSFGNCVAGSCCSKWGYCGKTSEYCSNSQGCQLAYGDCKCGNGFGNCAAGSCCSKYNYCGKTSDYCSASNGCQLSYGDCKCGSGFGNCPSGSCCSQYSYCGTSSAYCSAGCQSSFGVCSR